MKRILFILMAMLASCTQTPDKEGEYKGYQLPSYKVIKQEGAFELREYAPQLVAEVTVKGTRDEAVGKGFRLLADYIFGGNLPQEKLAMTTPVNQVLAEGKHIPMTTPVAQEQQGDSWKIQFGMPKEYTLETLPKAKNPQVHFRVIPAQQKAVIRFSGRANDESLAEHLAKLENWVKQQQWQSTGTLTYAYYDAPFTLPHNRRNEVLMEVK
jgi:hypothetical protein